MKGRLLLFAAALCLATNVIADPTTTDLATWASAATGTNLDRQTILPDGADPGATFATVVYLRNLAAPRVGRDADVDIIESFLAEGMLVVTMDYGAHAKARVPHLNLDIVKVRTDISADQDDGTQTRFPTGYAMDNNHIFIVPEGCRLLRDLVYETVSGMSRAMDVIYPANPLLPVGSLLEFSFDNVHRMNSANLGAFNDSILSAQASEGFATAMADHPVSGGYNGIDPMPDSALSARAAVRALRAQSAALGLNGRIATMGFSRGSGVALMPVTTKDVSEWRLYLSTTSFITLSDTVMRGGRDAYPDEDPKVQGALIFSGRFSYLDLLEDDPMLDRYTANWGSRETNADRWAYMGAADFLLTAPDYPLLLSLNENEDAHANNHMDVLKSRLDALGGAYLYAPDLEVVPNPHRLPLDPVILNRLNRYLRERLMLPSPYEVGEAFSLDAEVDESGNVDLHAPGILPPVDFSIEQSSDLEEWMVWGTVRPGVDGGLTFEIPASVDVPAFFRLGPPLDPAI